MQIRGSQELVRHVQQAGWCIGCGACVDVCPYFHYHKGQARQIFACDIEKGRCYAHCPKIEVDLDEISRRLRGVAYEGHDLGAYRSVMMCRKGTQMPKGRFQGGGTTSALMSFALTTGVIDAAILTDREGVWPHPRIVTQVQDVLRCAASKFTASPTLAALNRAVRQGYRRLGVVGTPCQITALAQLKGNPLETENFSDPVALSVGLFCNWALDPRSLVAFLSKRLDVSSLISMDIPPPPADVLTVRLEDGTLEIPLKDIRPLIPTTCFVCPDLTSEWADLSIGMFEGQTGWNTLVVRTKVGEDIVQDAEKSGYLEIKPMPQKDLSHLSAAGRAKKRRAFRTASRQSTINCDRDHAALRVPPEVLNRFC